METIRQGDVSMVRIKSLPKGAEDITPKEGRVVLAFGEVTGHAHAFYEHEKVRLWSANAERFMQVISKPNAKVEAWKVRSGDIGKTAYVAAYTDPLELIKAGWTILSLDIVDGAIDVHEEHWHPIIEPGIYQLPIQVEYTPAELVRVTD